MLQSHMLYEFQSPSEGFLKTEDSYGLNTVGAGANDGVCSKDLCVFCLIGFTSRCSLLIALSSRSSSLLPHLQHLPSPLLLLLLLTAFLQSDYVVHAMIHGGAL